MLTHIDEKGNATMVDVSNKNITLRNAYACSSVILGEKIFKLVKSNEIEKGDVLNTAKIAGIMAAKKTSNLIPLCHPLNITFADIIFQFDELNYTVLIFSKVSIPAKTGVEMEALTAVTVAALTIYDMCKGVDKGMLIGSTFLVKKTGGKSGVYRNKSKLQGYIFNDKLTISKETTVDIIGFLPEFLEKGDEVNILGTKCKINCKNNKFIISSEKDLNVKKGDKVWII